MWKRIKNVNFKEANLLFHPTQIFKIFEMKSHGYFIFVFFSLLYVLFTINILSHGTTIAFLTVIILSFLPIVFSVILKIILTWKNKQHLRLINYFIPLYLLMVSIVILFVPGLLFLGGDNFKGKLLSEILILVIIVYLNYILLKKSMSDIAKKMHVNVQLSKFQSKVENGIWLVLVGSLMFANFFRVFKVDSNVADQVSGSITSFSPMLLTIFFSIVIGVVPGIFLQFTLEDIMRAYFLNKYSEQFMKEYKISKETWRGKGRY
jgi:hypothetical protein